MPEVNLKKQCKSSVGISGQMFTRKQMHKMLSLLVEMHRVLEHRVVTHREVAIALSVLALV